MTSISFMAKLIEREITLMKKFSGKSFFPKYNYCTKDKEYYYVSTELLKYSLNKEEGLKFFHQKNNFKQRLNQYINYYQEIENFKNLNISNQDHKPDNLMIDE